MEPKEKVPKGFKECNISRDLWAAWEKLRRQGDPEAIAEKFNYSRPVVDNALNYGYVKMPGVTENITKFFQDRLKAEAKAGQELIQLAETLKP